MKVVSIFNRGVVVAAAGVFFFNSCANGDFAISMKDGGDGKFKDLAEVKAAIKAVKDQQEKIKDHKGGLTEQIKVLKLKEESEEKILNQQINEQDDIIELAKLQKELLGLKIHENRFSEIEKKEKIEKEKQKTEKKLADLKKKEEKLNNKKEEPKKE